MLKNRSTADETIEATTTAGYSLEAITQAVAKINDMNTQIASAAEEQTAVAEEINKNVANISGIANDTAEGARTDAEGSQQISRLAEQLRSLVARFRV